VGTGGSRLGRVHVDNACVIVTGGHTNTSFYSILSQASCMTTLLQFSNLETCFYLFIHFGSVLAFLYQKLRYVLFVGYRYIHESFCRCRSVIYALLSSPGRIQIPSAPRKSMHQILFKVCTGTVWCLACYHK
jgi:hypothetical protein